MLSGSEVLALADVCTSEIQYRRSLAVGINIKQTGEQKLPACVASVFIDAHSLISPTTFHMIPLRLSAAPLRGHRSRSSISLFSASPFVTPLFTTSRKLLFVLPLLLASGCPFPFFSWCSLDVSPAHAPSIKVSPLSLCLQTVRMSHTLMWET